MKTKNSIFCDKFRFNTGDYGYSEYTPGTDASMDCMKSVWDFNFMEDSHEEFVKTLRTAETCEHFVYVDKSK